jgi:hypothetical protein
MALRSKEWFYKNCLKEVKGHTRFSHLCWDILEKGIGQKDSTRGHVTQAIGACQQFLSEYPYHVDVIRKSDATVPFDVSSHATVRKDLVQWLKQRSGAYGPKAFGYNYDTLRNILTPTLGGTRRGGGGGNDEFKRVLRVLAEWI